MRRLQLHSSAQTSLLIAILFIVVGFAVYGTSLRNGFISIDDPLLIIDNPDIRQISGESLRSIFSRFDPELYMPLTFLTYQLEYAFGGLYPFTFHFFSLLLHILNAFFVYLLLRKLTGTSILSFVGGLLFLVHPLHTEAVVWASAHKDLLSATFFLSTLLTYLSFTKTGRRRVYYGSIFLFLLGLLSKPTVLVLPFVLLLLDWWKGKEFSRRLLAEKVPYLLLSIVFGFVAFIGKVQTVDAGSLSESALVGARGILMLLKRIVWPEPLSILYPYTGEVRLVSIGFLLPALAVLVLIFLAWRSRRRMPVLTVGLVWFALLVGPSMLNVRKGENFGDIYLTSDRYAYLASIGIILLLVSALQNVEQRVKGKRNIRLAFGTVLLGVVVVFSSATFSYSRQWKSERKLFNTVLQNYPDARLAHKIIGDEFREHGLLEQAIRHYSDALAIRPTGKVYAHLGQTYLDAGRLRESVDAFENTLKFNPLNAPVQLNIGVAYTRMGQLESARISFERAAELDPSSPLPQINLDAIRKMQEEAR